MEKENEVLEVDSDEYWERYEERYVDWKPYDDILYDDGREFEKATCDKYIFKS